MDALEDSEPEVDGAEDSDTKETVLDVDHSLDAVLAKRKTMKLCGVINRLQVLILVDSGSVGTFISSELAKKLPHVLTACCLHQNLGRRTRELEASRVVSLRNRLDVNRYQLI